MRNARFMHRRKEINPRFAIDLIKELPPIEVNTRVVACDGGGGAKGHPRWEARESLSISTNCISCLLPA